MNVCILLLTLLGLICLLIPFHIEMTGLCLLALAAVLLALRLLKKKGAGKVWSRCLMGLTALGMLVIFGSMLLIWTQGRDSDLSEKQPDFVVVLGAQVQGQQPSLTLKKRLDKALDYLNANPNASLYVSGGQGSDEAATEASVMARYLIDRGIDPARVLLEDKASNTRENLLFSAQLAKLSGKGIDTGKVLIITSDFHAARAKYLARTLGMEPQALTSPTYPWILKVNYYLREVFAFVKAFFIS